MDHEGVVCQKLTERYLLGELEDPTRQEFEEHYFDCPDCALDVRAGALFVEQSKVVLAEEPRPVPALPATTPAKPGWFGWFRPPLAVPVMALLLAVTGYQNLVTYPRLQQALNSPRVLPFAVLNVGTYGSAERVISTPAGGGFSLVVRIPPDVIYSKYSEYMAQLYNPAGKLEWTLPIPASSTQDQYSV